MRRVTDLLRGEEFRARAMRGSMLTVISFGGRNALRLGSNLILTRILFPEAFGVMALVQVFLTGLQMFSDLGLNASVIRSERGDDPRFLETAWTVQLLRGLLLWLCAVALAAPIAAFYEEPMLEAILPVVGLTAICLGAASINIYTANRKLLLGRLTVLELGTQVFGMIVMIVGALILQSVWALVIGSLAQALSKALLSHVVLPGGRAHLRLEPAAFGELFHFGKWIFLSTIAGFLLKHGDRAILGKYITLSELAFYNIAFMLSTVPFLLITSLNSRILFPLYCNRPPAESAANRSHIRKARFLLIGGTFAFSAPLVLFGQEIIEFLYDPRYHMAGPIAVAIGFAWMFRIVTAGYDRVLLAVGEARTFAGLLVVSATLRTGLILLGVIQFGIPGVIAAALLAELLIYPLLAKLVHRYRAWDGWQDAGFALVALAVLALTLWRNPEVWGDFLSLTATG